MADYYSVIAHAVSALSSNTDEARDAVYERARSAFLESLRTHDPPLSPAELATEQFALEAAISRVETELRRSAREEATLSPPSSISRVREFVGSVWDRLALSIMSNRSRLSKITKVVATKAEITERLKAKNIGRRIFSLNWKGTTVLMGSEGAGLFMWWWRKVRRANIPEELRATFEQFGETVITTFLATGTTAKYTYTGPLGVLNESWQEALAWLAERRDIQERREDRRETVEWAILIWVIMGVVADIIMVMRP